MRLILLWALFLGLYSFGNLNPKVSASAVENCQAPIKDQLSRIEKHPNEISKQRAEKSRLNFYLGRCAWVEKNSELAMPFFEKGLAEAEAALESKSDDWEAIFWWGANKGSIADIDRGLSALKTIRTIEEKMIEMKENQPDYGFAGPNRVLGKIYQNAPRFISVGSSSKAEKALKNAYERFPNFPGNVIALAEFYEDEGRTDDAKKILLPLIESDAIRKGDFGIFNVEKADWEATSQVLLKKWGRKSE